MKQDIRLSSFATRVGALLLIFACSAAAQKPKPPDASHLSAQFNAVFGKDFDLIKSEFKTRSNARGGGTYWLAYLAPKRSGYFYLRYSYKDSDPLYSHVEHEIHLGVGPKGCHRGESYARVYSRFCLGDTIILPVIVNNFTEHEFKLVKAEYSTSHTDWETFDERYPDVRNQDLDQTEVANPAAENLRYVGRGSHKSPHRALGYTLESRAVFEALKPGRLNLIVSTAPASGLSTGRVSSAGAPIIVIARDAPITMIAGHEEVRGFRKGYDGREYVSSTSGNSYATTLIVLQPGDRIAGVPQRLPRAAV